MLALQPVCSSHVLCFFVVVQLCYLSGTCLWLVVPTFVRMLYTHFRGHRMLANLQGMVQLVKNHVVSSHLAAKHVPKVLARRWFQRSSMIIWRSSHSSHLSLLSVKLWSASALGCSAPMLQPALCCYMCPLLWNPYLQKKNHLFLNSATQATPCFAGNILDTATSPRKTNGVLSWYFIWRQNPTRMQCWRPLLLINTAVTRLHPMVIFSYTVPFVWDLGG